MELWQDGLLALLAAWGLAGLLWTLTEWIFRLGRRRFRGGIFLLPLSGDAAQLEEQLRQLTRLSQHGLLPKKIVLVDCGLTEQGQKMACLFSRSDSWITLLPRDRIENCLDDEKGGCPHERKLSDGRDHLPSGVSE